MSWRFRKTFRVIPGVRLNLGRHGVSATFGRGPLSINVGPRGVYKNVSIPGTGISSRERIGGPALPSPRPTQRSSDKVKLPGPVGPALPEIHSARPELLTSDSLEELRTVLAETFQERVEIQRELSIATSESANARRRYDNWDRGFLLRRLFAQAFASRKEIADTAAARVEELEEQLRQTVLATEIAVDPEQAEPYQRLSEAFGGLAKSHKIWNVLAAARIDRAVERSKAGTLVTRAQVVFSLNSCDLIQCEEAVPHLPNRTGGDMYVYPGFILYKASRRNFALVDFRDVMLTFISTEFTEADAIPADAEIVGKTWAKCNKDGSPDRRFVGNHQIPVARYGSLVFRSKDGLDVRYLCSNPRLAEQFAKAWLAFRMSISDQDDTDEKNQDQAKRHQQRFLDAFGAFRNANDKFLKALHPSDSTFTMSEADFGTCMAASADFVGVVTQFVEMPVFSPQAASKAMLLEATAAFEKARTDLEDSAAKKCTDVAVLKAYANGLSGLYRVLRESFGSEVAKTHT
jgi:Protein of unknown function (DUF4236)